MIMNTLIRINPHCHIVSATEDTTYDGFDGFGPEIENRLLEIILFNPDKMACRTYRYGFSRILGTNDPGNYILME